MYGKGHPLDTFEVYGKYLKAVNAKDGLPHRREESRPGDPTRPGKVGFPRFLRRLNELGYTAPIIIEREITEPQLLEDPKQSKAYLEKLLSEVP